MILYILKKKKKSKMDILSYVEQYSHGLSFVTKKRCVKFFNEDEANRAKKLILHEFHTVVIVESINEDIGKEIN